MREKGSYVEKEFQKSAWGPLESLLNTKLCMHRVKLHKTAHIKTR